MTNRTDDRPEDKAVINVTGIDAYAPAEIAQRVRSAGQVKAELPLDKLATLGLPAGVFIGFGAALSTLVLTGSELGFGPGRLLAGVAFSLGLILVVVAGAELFTGNALIVMAWAEREVSTAALARNWAVSLVANGIGALGLAFAIHHSGVLELGGAKETAVRIAETKASLSIKEAFVRGILCNVLVCLAVWLSFACHSVTDKILAIMPPIAAFVALGFEHSVANFYLLPLGMLSGASIGAVDILGNLVPVILGNLVGGAGGVASVYWLIYLRDSGKKD
jgi:formate transporter